MAKLVYVMITRWGPETGVGKKIRNELKAFEMHGIETEVVEVEEKKKWQKILPFSSTHHWENVNIQGADYIYVRHETVNAPFINFLKRCKKNNPGAKIVMEIGTYPYYEEIKKVSNPLTVARDCFYQKFLKKYVDKITTFTSFEEIFGIPVIELVNCVEVDAVHPPKRDAYRNDKIINVIAVASVYYYYGFDRFLRGLAEYYKSEQAYEVRFHLVGDGPALEELKQLSKDLHLDPYVTFYGFKTGKELEEIYELADVGIDVLGGHRKGDIWFGTLKSREYICKGLPFITEYTLPDNLQPIRKYLLKVKADPSPVCINDVVDFMIEIKNESRLTTIRTMREFAYSYCDVSVAMNPVINYLKV